MTEILRFIARASRQSEARTIIIPKRLHGKLEPVTGKQVIVTITGILP